MDESSGFGNAGSSFWPSLAPFQIRVYLRGYAKRSGSWRVRVMPTSGDGRTVHEAWNGAKRERRVCEWIRKSAHCACRNEVLRQDNAPWLDMLFLRCIEDRGYMVRVAELVPQYVGSRQVT